MKTKTTIALYGTAAGGQGGSSKMGRNYQTVDKQYGFVVHEDQTPSEAEKAALARPYTRVQSQPDVSTTPEVRDLARKRLVKTNPDIDAGGPGSGRHKELMTLKQQFLDKIKDLREHGTERMSKTGVKWSIQTHRASLKRINQLLKELKHVQ